MNTSLTDFIDLRKKYLENNWVLNCDIAFIPSNIDSISTEDYYYENSVKTLKTLFRNSHIPFEFIDSDKIGYRQLNAFEWIGPIIFFGYSVFTENPTLISISCGVISNYLTDFFRGISGKKNIKLDIVVETEKGKTYKKIHFEGTPESLKDLPEIIKAIK